MLALFLLALPDSFTAYAYVMGVHKDFHTLAPKTSQISKILPFLVINTGSILIGPPLKNILPTPMKTIKPIKY